MRKSNKFLIIALLFFCTSWAKEKRAEVSDINSFLKNLTEISLPFSTESLPRAQKASNDFFYYEKGNTYYELNDLKCFGYFKKEDIIYVVYGFNLIGIGEGQANDMVVLSSFYKTGKHIEDIELGGSNGGEGGGYTYEKAVVTGKDITVHLTDEHYESDTGLPYPIIEYKTELYKFEKQKYVLVDQTFRCDNLKNLEEYHLQLKKGASDPQEPNYGLSYKLDNYIHCFPITKQNASTYYSIDSYLKKAVNNHGFLSKAIKNATKNNHILTVIVNNLRLRNDYNLKGKVIELLPLNSELTYTKKKSSSSEQIKLNEKEISDYWYKVKTEKGNIGWVHGCCINF